MWVERLFRDLCSHVMALTNLPAGSEPGFMDREIRSGEGWSERLGRALATSRVFVPLFSPRYFASEMCGKEWYAFAQRAVHHGAVNNQSAEAIVPALWVPVPPDRLPGPAERLQFNHNAFGERYVTDGLYGLIKLRGYADQYERAVYELARRIVSTAEAARLEPSRPVDYRTVPSAFGAVGALPAPSTSRWRPPPGTICRRGAVPSTTGTVRWSGIRTIRRPGCPSRRWPSKWPGTSTTG